MDLEADLAAAVISGKDGFLSMPLRARPIGFWNASEDLRHAFARDRYLICFYALAGLGKIHDNERVLDTLPRYSRDPSPRIRNQATYLLADFDDPRKWDRIVELIGGGDELSVLMALDAIRNYRYRANWKTSAEFAARPKPVLEEVLSNEKTSSETRLERERVLKDIRAEE